MPPVGFEPKFSAGKRPAAARLLRSWVRIPPGAWIFVCCECRVLSGRGLCDELFTRPEESYRLCCVVVFDLEKSRMGAPYIYDISRLRVKCFVPLETKYERTARATRVHSPQLSQIIDSCCDISPIRTRHRSCPAIPLKVTAVLNIGSKMTCFRWWWVPITQSCHLHYCAPSPLQLLTNQYLYSCYSYRIPRYTTGCLLPNISTLCTGLSFNTSNE